LRLPTRMPFRLREVSVRHHEFSSGGDRERRRATQLSPQGKPTRECIVVLSACIVTFAGEARGPSANKAVQACVEGEGLCRRQPAQYLGHAHRPVKSVFGQPVAFLAKSSSCSIRP
jgi:hypothetical protein